MISVDFYKLVEQEEEAPRREIIETAEALSAAFEELGISLVLTGYTRGARVTRYEFARLAGVRVAEIADCVDEIQRMLGTHGVRIEAPIPNRTVIGVEVPNRTQSIVSLQALLDSTEFREAESGMVVALGTDLAGAPVFFDIAKAPHLLIAGSVGTGKSVCINSILISLLKKSTPDDLRLILIDPRKVEFSFYSRVPHLLIPAIGDVNTAAGALRWAVNEMERRYDLIAAAGMRDLKSYNGYCKDAGIPPLPKILIVIDDLCELMMSARGAVEPAICRIAQKARAAGIHLIIGTQSPSAAFITRSILVNIPARLSLRLWQAVDSRAILDTEGAERLLPYGDMLFSPMGTPLRMQGAHISNEELCELIDRVVEAHGAPQFDDALLAEIKREAENAVKESAEAERSLFEEVRTDPKFEAALDIVFDTGNVSTSLLQRKLSIGYGKAARFIDVMHELGIVGEALGGARPRELLITREEYEKRKAEAAE